MSASFPSSLEDTISIYKNKFLIDLDDENDEAPSLQNLRRPSTEQSNDQDTEQDLRSDTDDSYLRDKTRGRKSRLPRDLAGLMGQANVSFARGEHNDAIIMCQEVIRYAPKCAEPFISLAEHYHETKDEEKAEQLYLIAAYLQPSNTDLWVKVAESATRRREFRLATTCYTKAIRAEKNEAVSIKYHLKRCNLYEKLGDQKKALKGYENLIALLGPDDKEFGIELSRGIARIYKAENKLDSCIRTLEAAFEKYPTQICGADITQLGECYNCKENFPKTLDLVTKKCRLTIMINGTNSWDLESFSNLYDRQGVDGPRLAISTESTDNRFCLENRCLLLVALISLGYHDNTIQPLVGDLDSVNLNSSKQSLYQVAKAYYSQSIYDKAKEILLRLTTRQDSQAAPIWLLYSQCLKNLNEIDGAIVAYQNVISHDLNDYSSRLALSNLLSVQGRLDEALEVTKQPLFVETPVDIQLLYQSCQLLERMKRWPEYCESAKALLLTDIYYTQHPKEITCMITSKSFRTRQDNLRAVQRDLSEDPTTHRQKSIGAKLDLSSMLSLFLRYTQVLFHELEDYQELKRISFSAYTSPTFECHESSIDFYTAVSCVLSGDKEFTYHHLKVLASRNPEHNQIWNLLSMVMSNIYQDLRHGRFCMRLYMKNPDISPLIVFNGNNALMSGTYKHALHEYMKIFKDRPNDPYVAMCIALTYLSLSCQRYVSSKYLCLFQMIAFLHVYVELRGSCQETMYNIGRVFHQMSMLEKAVIFYKRALEMDDRPRIERLKESDEEFDETFSIRREAAFNLALIYKNSQSYGLAYQVLKDNFTI